LTPKTVFNIYFNGRASIRNVVFAEGKWKIRVFKVFARWCKYSMVKWICFCRIRKIGRFSRPI